MREVVRYNRTNLPKSHLDVVEAVGMEKPQGIPQPVKPQLGLWDAVSIIIGIVIGAGIYETAPLILINVSTPWMGLVVWGLGGVLSLIGALCYAELATTYPRLGGDYVYLTRAFGSWVGFLFGWAQLAVILTASIGMMAFVFARYAVNFSGVSTLSLGEAGPSISMYFLFASLAVAVLSLLNILGVVLGKVTQNILSLVKVLGLGAILVAGFVWGQHAGTLSLTEELPIEGLGFGLAMILVLYTYGGWNDAAFVAAEVRDRRRNIPRALILGTALITLIYLGVNAAYMLGLGFKGAREADAVASDVLKLGLDQYQFGAYASAVMSVLVMISALGAVNGLIFTGSRVYSTLGSEHSVFAFLGRWSPRFNTPVWSLLAQGIISILMIGIVGTETGRGWIDRAGYWLGDWIPEKQRFNPIDWRFYGGGFSTLLAATAPVFWAFFLLTGLSLFKLREMDKGIERPFSVPFYPFTPFIFCLMCTYMLYSAITYAGWLTLLGAIPLALGLPLYFVSRRRAPVEDALDRGA